MEYYINKDSEIFGVDEDQQHLIQPDWVLSQVDANGKPYQFYNADGTPNTEKILKEMKSAKNNELRIACKNYIEGGFISGSYFYPSSEIDISNLHTASTPPNGGLISRKNLSTGEWGQIALAVEDALNILADFSTFLKNQRLQFASLNAQVDQITDSGDITTNKSAVDSIVWSPAP